MRACLRLTRPRAFWSFFSDNEVRFAIYLLGVGGPFGLGQRLTGFGQ